MNADNFLYVWAYPYLATKPVLCGTIELLMGRRCIFSYDDSWLNSNGHFALAPDMPLRPGVIEPSMGLDLHPIFDDAGPDRWGKNIINKVFNPSRRSPLEYLERAGEDRIGALGFSRSDVQYEVLAEQSFQVADLPNLVHAANTLSIHEHINEDLRRLLRPGASAGGARPKAVVQEHGESWLAKFPMPDDDMDNCAIEHACLKLAESCGITVPESRLIKISGQNILLVKRFDREQGGRLHYASARTLLIASGIPEDMMSYGDLADVVRNISAEPQKMCHELFRRMAFNVLIDNTDDHAKNHAFICRDGKWALSPAYDMQPQCQGVEYQQLIVGKHGHVPNMANILSDSARFLLRHDAAITMLEDVIQQLERWPEIFEGAGVAPRDLNACAAYMLNDRRFDFGLIPNKFSDSNERQDYIGPIVAMDQHFAYQDIGRRNIVRHDRTNMKLHPLPGQSISIRYENGKALVVNKEGGRKLGLGE
jgi:serine/threonine-protein kinase HipA